MKQAEMVKPGQIVLHEAARPKPAAGEALIRIAKSGVCGSDVHAYLGEHPFISCPVTPGHEFSGVIAELGAGVQGLSVGSKVTVEPSLVCGTCYNCRRGRYNICQNLTVIGCQSPGAMAEYLAVPAGKVIPLPEGMSYEEGALVEPLAVAVRVVSRGGYVGGKKVVIQGAGTIGLLTMQAARAHGAAAALQVAVVASRLELARKLGADHVANVKEKSLASAIQEYFGPDGADIIYECVGVESTISQAIEVARKGSVIVVAGVFGKRVNVDMALVQDHELELIGTLMYTRPDFLEAVRLIAEKKVQVLPLVTHRYALDQAAQAFETARAGGEKALKVLVNVGEF
jgi:L-iditol 2-dehydrogenase